MLKWDLKKMMLRFGDMCDFPMRGILNLNEKIRRRKRGESTKQKKEL